MLRAILAVVVGYVVLFVLVAGLFMAAYAVLGPDRAYQPGSYEPSTLWIALSAVIGFFAAAVGGTVAAKVGGSRGAKWLMWLVLVLGALTVAVEVMRDKPAPEARTGDVSYLDSMKHARQPSWVTVMNTVVGVVGVAFGASRVASKKKG